MSLVNRNDARTSGTASDNAKMPASAPMRPSGVRIPTLRAGDLPADWERDTCFQAGYLVSKNAGWRQDRPIIDTAKCTGCLTCYMVCPDGAIFKVPDSSSAASTSAPIAVDLDFCKGCGICAHQCPVDAIVMVSERQVLS